MAFLDQLELPLAEPVSDRVVAVPRRSESVIEEFLQPIIHVPRHPLTAIRFGLSALLSAWLLVRSHSFGETAAALFAGLAAHSFFTPLVAWFCAFGLELGTLGHSVGWPIPGGVTQTISNALLGHLKTLGGEIQTGEFVRV
jgi:phytoene dehydrogenase-like protein